jgi:hypothetical protein
MMTEQPGYQIAVSYPGLESIANALAGVAEAFNAVGPRLRGRRVVGATNATELGELVLTLAADTTARAAGSLSSLAGTISRTRDQYANHEQVTATELSSGSARIENAP